jgi:hypothetical protein
MTTKPQQNMEIVHDRQAEVEGIGMVVDVVDNPYGAGKISVTRSTRDDPLAGMHSRGVIDAAQYAAGRHWQRAWEDSEIGAVRAVDTTREPVDGCGAMHSPFSDKQRDAFKELQMASVVLGFEGDMIVREVLGNQRMPIAAVAQRHGRPKKFMGQRFRECLEALAKLWSYA